MMKSLLAVALAFTSLAMLEPCSAAIPQKSGREELSLTPHMERSLRSA